jgi:hypothetical protein
MRWIFLTLLLSSCGLTSLIPTGGTNVAANTQLGSENNQNVGVTTYNKPEIKPEGPVDTVNQDNSTTNISEIDPLLIILLVLGWLAPSPSEMGRGLLKLFRRKE